MINKIWQGFRLCRETKEEYKQRMNHEYESYGYTKEQLEKEQALLPKQFTEDLYIDWKRVKIVQLKQTNGQSEQDTKWSVVIDGIVVFDAPNTFKGYELANVYKEKCLKAWNEAKLFQDLEDDNRL